MSLLMDALRKAEESKKQAEQDKKAGVDTDLDNAADASDTLPKPQGSSTANQSKLDIPVEFEDANENLSSSSPLQSDTGKDTESNAESTLELAPKLDAEPGSLEYEPEQRIPADDLENGLQRDQQTLVDAQSSFDSAQDTENPETYPSVDQAEIETGSKSENSRADDGISTITAPEEQLTSSVISAEDDKTEALFSIPQPKAESIVEKTAGSRLSAKTVFAAKKKPTNRRGILLGVAGIAAVLVLGMGFYFYNALSTQSGILIPEANLSVNQSSEDFFTGNQAPETGNLASGSIQRDELVGATSAFEETNLTVAIESVEQVGDIVDPLVDSDRPILDSAESIIATENSTTSLSPIEAVTIGVENVTEVAQEVLETNVTAEITEIDIPTIESVISESVTSLAETENGSVVETGSVASTTSSTNSTALESAEVTGLGASNLSTLQAPEARELVSFRRTELGTPLSQLTQAYSEYQSGDMESARDLYDQALQMSPRNKDAMLGLAAIAITNEQPNRALELYSRVLALDPSDAIAKTAIRSLVPLGSPSEQERELRRLNSQHPNVAALVFALGNFYAGQSRWSDAQQQYFRALQLSKSGAVSGAAVSPDYAFNLAVSLEQLNQPRPAMAYYEEALTLAARSPANFDVAVAQRRLQRLSRSATQ